MAKKEPRILTGVLVVMGGLIALYLIKKYKESKEQEAEK